MKGCPSSEDDVEIKVMGAMDECSLVSGKMSHHILLFETILRVARGSSATDHARHDMSKAMMVARERDLASQQRPLDQGQFSFANLEIATEILGCRGSK